MPGSWAGQLGSEVLGENGEVPSDKIAKLATLADIDFWMLGIPYHN